MLKQLSLCPAYGAEHADYRVIELSGTTADDSRAPPALAPSVGKEVNKTRCYDSAADSARQHCVLSGREVWVFDRNDDDAVVFRVRPADYTAQALGSRYPVTA